MNKNTSCNLSEINEEYLVTYLSKLFYERGIDSNKVKGPSKTKYNIWNDISLHIFNEFSYRCMYQLWNWLRANTRSFKTKVIDSIKILKESETFRNKDRSKMALKLEAHGSYNVRNELLLSMEDNQIPNPQTFKNILYESRHKHDLLHTNYLVDAIACYWNDKEENFIHNIGLNPFGALLATNFQVKMIKIYLR